jgi:hypothetical protein
MAKQVKIDIVARDKTKQAINKSKKGLDGLKKSVLSLKSAFIGLGAGLVLKSFVDVGKEVESLQVRFKFLFGSAKEGAKAFDNLADFAAKVPFSLGDIAAASGNLAVVSKDAEDLSRILKITGNVAATTGLDFQTTASQIQRAFSGGIAAADVFREKGVRSLLGFEQGAKVSIKETIDAFESVFSGEGRFGKATDELAKTFEGTVSMLQDSVFKFQKTVAEGFMGTLTKELGNLKKFLDENQKEIDEFATVLGESLAGAILTLGSSVKTVKNNFVEFEAALGALLLVAGGFFKVIAGGALVFDSITRRQKELLEMTQRYNAELQGQSFDEYHDQILRLADGYGVLEEAIGKSDETVKEGNFVLDERTQIMKANILEMERAKIASQQLREQLSKELNFDNKMQKAKEKSIETESKKREAEQEGLRQTGQALQRFAAEGAKRSKKMFRLQQAVQIGEAIMNTYAGATKALATLPPPFSFAVAALTVATGLAQVANIKAQQPPAQFGGARQAGSPFLVGERGPELFTPATAGTVTPNHQLPSGGNTVNFNITTVDAQSFGALLDTRRGQIVNMINTALNNKGQAALV